MNVDNREYKRLPFYVQKLDEEQGIVDAIVAVMGNVDRQHDIIDRGAFQKTISERGSKIKVLDNHNTRSVRDVVGKPILFREVNKSALPAEVLEAYPDATGGLFASIQFLMDTPEGEGVFKRIKSGAVGEYSIGYDTINSAPDTVKQDGEDVPIRRLKEVKLWEISPVIFGANPATATLDAKGEDERASSIAYNLTINNNAPVDVEPSEAKPAPEVTENTIRIRVRNPGDFQDDSFRTITIGDEEQGIQAVIGRLEGQTSTMTQAYVFDKAKWTVARATAWVDEHESNKADNDKAATGKANLPLAPRDRAWDATAANARLRTWADAEDEPNARYRQGFFWYDADKPDEFGSYKLQFADVIGGEIQAVPRGIFAVAAVLQGSRGGVDIPAADAAAIRGRVNGYYAKMRSKFDDDSIVPPWEKSAAFIEAIEKAQDGDIVEIPNGLVLERSVTLSSGVIYIGETTATKAGRVLAARNEQRIVAALRTLVDVLEDAGINIPTLGQAEPEEDSDEEKATTILSDFIALTTEPERLKRALAQLAPAVQAASGAGPDDEPLTSSEAESDDVTPTPEEIAMLELELQLLEV